MLAADHMYHHHEYATILSKILKIIIPSTYRFHDRKEIIFSVLKSMVYYVVCSNGAELLAMSF